MQRYCNPQQLHSNCASKHWVLPLGKGPPYWLPPGRSQLICSLKVGVHIEHDTHEYSYPDFECNGTVGHLNN